ncbi:uncharacterized protein LOC142338477 isoform X2 [Convolutriloba macropyga]|uniref:uncharacterized protein LOC142338477 isoform X2 n=1 Tax=Convolutriloba macropyga TaxID=536237 RepID=UPI003F51F777
MQNDSLSMEPQHFLPLLILILSLILVTFFLIEFDQILQSKFVHTSPINSESKSNSIGTSSFDNNNNNIFHQKPLSHDTDNDCGLKSLQSVQYELQRLNSATNNIRDTSANQSASSGPVTSFSRPNRVAYDLSMYLTETTAPYYAKAEVSLTLGTAVSPKPYSFGLMNSLPSSSESDGVQLWRHSEEKLVSLCLLFDKQNAQLAQQATINLHVRHKFKHLIMQGGSGVNTNNSGLRSSCRGIVDYCYAFPLLTPEGLQEIYDDLAESQNYSDKDHSDEHKSDNSDEARGGSGLNKMTFSIHISNISNQSLATATTSSKVSPSAIDGFQLLVETASHYDLITSTTDGTDNYFATFQGQSSGNTFKTSYNASPKVTHPNSTFRDDIPFAVRALSSLWSLNRHKRDDILSDPDIARKCDPDAANTRTCVADNSYCCHVPKEYSMTEVLNAVMPKEAGVRYEAMVPLIYKTLVCKKSAVWRDDEKIIVTQDEESIRSEIPLTKNRGDAESECMPYSYKSGTIVYYKYTTLPDGTEVKDNKLTETFPNYEIEACTCRGGLKPS